MKEKEDCEGRANEALYRVFVIAAAKEGRWTMAGQPSRELERLIKKFSLPVRFISTRRATKSLSHVLVQRFARASFVCDI